MYFFKIKSITFLISTMLMSFSVFSQSKYRPLNPDPEIKRQVFIAEFKSNKIKIMSNLHEMVAEGKEFEAIRLSYKHMNFLRDTGFDHDKDLNEFNKTTRSQYESKKAKEQTKRLLAALKISLARHPNYHGKREWIYDKLVSLNSGVLEYETKLKYYQIEKEKTKINTFFLRIDIDIDDSHQLPHDLIIVKITRKEINHVCKTSGWYSNTQ